MKGNLFYLTEKLVLKPFACIGVTQLVAGASKGKLWVGVRHCSAVPGAVPARPLLYTPRHQHRHIVPEIVPARRVLLYDGRHGETPATFGQLKRQLGPAGTHTGAFKLSCFCCCMSDTQNCTSRLPKRKSYIFVFQVARLSFESVNH